MLIGKVQGVAKVLAQEMNLLPQQLAIDRRVQFDGFCAGRNELGSFGAEQVDELLQSIVLPSSLLAAVAWA